jgi:hypothetical protein
MLDTFLYICYAFIGIAILSSILLPLLNAIKNPQGLVKSLIGVGALVVLFIVSYALSSDQLTLVASSHGVDSASTKMIGAGMIMFYIALIIAMVLAVLSLIRDLINN